MKPTSEDISSGGAAAVLGLLYDVTHEFSSTLELPVVLGKVLSLTVQSLGAETGSIFMLDGTGHVVRHILARQDLPPEVRELVVATVMDRGLAGWVFRQRVGALVEDTATDPRWHTFDDDNQEVRSALAAPLLRRGSLSGIITLTHPEPGAFGRAEYHLLIAIAHQAAVAIENARLFTAISDERDSVAAVLNGVRDAILAVEGDEHYLTVVNPAAARILGVATAAEAIGRPLAEFVAPALLRLVEQVRAGEETETEVSIGGDRYFDAIVQAIPRVGTVVALHDVTTFRQLDAMKSEFVASVSHDLKNPLGTILGYVWLLGDEPGLSDEQISYVNTIRDTAQRMQVLVGNLLDLAKIEAGVDSERDMCTLSEVVAAACQEHIDAASAKEIVLERDVPAELPQIQANKLRVTQALSNLVGNAIKYTPSGGHVLVQARSTSSSVILGVIDDGPGISSEDQNKLFQKFSRVGDLELQKIAGTGLGLAIVRSVVESHGGRVWVESELGQGSAFYIELKR